MSVIWILGLSGAGKTTLANGLYNEYRKETANLIHVDGDHIRNLFSDGMDHTVEGRRKNAQRIAHLCKFLDDQGIHVICSVLSIFPDWLAWHRKNYSAYFEIFLDVPMETLIEQEDKNIYRDFLDGKMSNVVGMDIEFPRPQNPDLVISPEIRTKGSKTCLQAALSALREWKAENFG